MVDREAGYENILQPERLLADERGEISALHVVHREVRLALLLARLVNADDVRMLQPRRRLHLHAKSQRLFPAGELARENHLYGDDAIQLSLPRLEDDAHSAPRDFLQQFVVAKVTIGSVRGLAPDLFPWR